MKRFKKVLWALLLLLLIGGTTVVISGLERDMQSGYIAYMGDHQTEMLNGAVESNEWEINPGGAFFMEYRLQRDRIRSQEVEMLEGLLNNPNTSESSKQEAEKMIIELVEIMEQELLIENMIKAQGFEDAIFFYRNEVATVMVKQQEISEREFIQITDAVAGVAGISREDIQVIARY